MNESADVNGVQVELKPTHFLQEWNGSRSEVSTALIILHAPIQAFEYFSQLFQHASFCICADGAANRLHDAMISRFPQLDWEDALRKAAPDLIHGDLDSLDDKVRERYEHVGVKTSQDPDQYSTDVGKVMNQVARAIPDVQDVLVLGSLGGRVDHGIGLISELYHLHKFDHPHTRFWLFSESSVSVILRSGTSVVHTPLSSGLITRNIGILPVYGPAVISTQGCEWDVQDWPTEMGGQVSTSNHIVSDYVKVTTSHDVLLTIELRGTRNDW